MKIKDFIKTYIATLNKRRTALMSLATIVVFITTYMLVLPAITLEQDEAEKQGGIDLPKTEQSVDKQDQAASDDSKDAEAKKEDVKDKDASADQDAKKDEAKTEDKTDSAKDEQSSSDSAKAGLAFEGEGYSITAKAGSDAKLPEDTKLTAKEVKSDEKKYDALCKEAEKALNDSPLVKDDVSVKSAKFYDITLESDGKDVEPAADVNVKITYDKSLKMSKSGDVYVIHFAEDKNGKMKPEVLKDSAVDVKSKAGSKSGTIEVSDVAFDASGFSMYGLVETTTLEETVVTADGKNYKVTVSAGKDAKLPKDAGLEVSEITEDNDKYADYVADTEKVLKWHEGDVDYARLFDISIVDKDGNKIQPEAPVDVKIELADAKSEKLNIVHFGKKTEVIDASAKEASKGYNVSFEASGFSVYAVVEDSTDDNARMTIEFYSKGTKIATMYVKNGDTADELETILYDPGAGTLGEGESFMGWILDNENFTTADLGDVETIEQIREWAGSHSIREGEKHRVDAAICKLYTITYKDDDTGDNTVLGMHAVPVKSEEYGTASVDTTVNMAYTPKDDVHNFEGWILSENSEGNVTSTIPDDRIYQNGNSITIKGDITFEVNEPPGKWLVFDENGKGGTYNAPQFVKAGETTQQPCPDTAMLRNGYTFGGWYDTKAHADAHGQNPNVTTGEFTFGGELVGADAKTTIYASWIPNTKAPYTVIFWTQKEPVNGQVNNDKETGYDLKESVVINDGNVGQNIPYTIRNNGNGDEKYVTVNGKDYHYTGFCVQQPEQQVTITPEGDAVLNLYFNRIKYDLRFYLYRRDGNGANDYQFAQNSEAGNNIWGVVNWYNKTSFNNMPTTTYPGGIQSQSGVDGNNRTGYYIVLSAYYGEDISGKWPTYNMIGSGRSGNTNYAPVSYVMMVGTKLKPNPSNGGDGTLKGVYNRMDENILGDTNDADGNFLIVRFNSYNDWTYHCYFEAYDGQNLDGKTTRVINGKTYYLDHDFKSRSSNTLPGSQNPPQYAGFSAVMQSSSRPYYDQVYIDGRLNGTPQANSVSGHEAELNYYYDRLSFPINYMDGTYYDGDGNPLQNRQEELLHKSSPIDYQAPIPDSYKEYTPELPQGEDGYVFAGWYADSACNTPYTFTTMPIGGIIVYAKWIKKEYRVFLHPNAGSDPDPLEWGSENVKTSFRVDYGDKVSTPTGKREGTGYEFVGWYTDPNFSPGSLYNSDTVLNEHTVTTPYYQTEPTETDKWGDPTSNINKDAQGNRFWITEKLDLYAKWRKILEGSEGINVVYSAIDDEGNEGTNPPVDYSIYPDMAEATAQAAATAPSGMTFSHWIIQKWDETKGEYVDTNLEPLDPGNHFIVSEEYARKQEDPENPGKYIYTIQLRAEYTSHGDKMPTHIWWFNNYSESGAERHNSSRQDEGISINQAVDIQKPPTRNGYVFLGWARLSNTTTESTAGSPPTGKVLTNLGENDLYLKYENGQFKLNDPGGPNDGKDVTQVAADERTPYHDMYAVWKKLYTVKVKKVVESTIDSDKTIDFSFAPKIDGSSEAVFTLKDGMIKEYEKMFTAGMKFSVTETLNNDFDTAVSGTYTDDDGNTHEYSNLENGSEITIQGDTEIIFTNTRKTVPINIKKVDENNQPLTGATFQLQIKNERDIYINNGDPFTIDAEGAVYTIQLPSGDYKIIEIEAPAGYIIKSPGEEFHVDAAASSNVITLGEHTDASIDTSDATGKTMLIANHPGAELSSTGGMGTTWIYLLGTILLLGCGITLIARRRIRSN